MTAAMRKFLQQAWERLSLDPSKVSLGWWLAMTNVIIVALVVVGISTFAVRLLRDQANAQGQARVQLAGAMAREDLRRDGEDALGIARAVAANATLTRLVAEERAEAARPVLRRFCLGAAADACAVVNGLVVVARAGVDMPWSELLTSEAEQGERFLAAPKGLAHAVLGASAPFANLSGFKVLVARVMDDKVARELSQHAGLPVRLIDYRTFAAAPVDDFTALHTAGLADGRSALARIESQDLYAASFPVFAASGEAVTLIETRLPTKDLDAAVARLVRRLLITALVIGLLAVAAGILLGRQVADPSRALTEAAARLGRGDFSISIPAGGVAEMAVLARTMEDMRRNLVDLTGTLRRREAEAQAVLGGIVEGVFAVDRNRVIRYLNPQAAKLLGVDANGAIGRFCGDVLKPEPVDGERPCRAHCPILQAQTAGNARAVEHLVPAEGNRRTTVITSAAMVDGLQVQVIRDETELEAVRRARDSVLANISHEFRTPLAAQLASIELLRGGLETMPPEQRLELVMSLQRGTLRLTRLIDNLLESVRIESGQLGIRRQSIALRDVVTDAEELVAPLLAQRHQQLRVALPENLASISADAPRLTQVFVNLLANASKFSPEGSAISVGAEQRGQTIAVWVDDPGTGLPAGDAESIFDRFRRGADDEPAPGGLGLGLWIVKSIVDRHGGAIDATRTPADHTRFTITLPVEPPI
ncbi:MAG TPA: ATP-binding protein [Steroidobacteraceae bacterium]